jgi:hypothetical protein
VLGGLGLVLPGIARIQRWLTPVAAAGLALVMIGAVATTVAVMGVVPALYPLVVGALLIIVMKARAGWVSHS